MPTSLEVADIFRAAEAQRLVSSDQIPVAKHAEPEAERSDAQLTQWLAFLVGNKVQTKLQVSSPGDAQEREADAVADQVMNHGSDTVAISGAAVQLSRKCEACEDDEQKVQRKANGPPTAVTASPTAGDALNSSGRALDSATHDFMASRFGTDFAEVRIHTGEKAARSAAALGAKPYTVGRDIVFGDGQFAPSGTAGRHLLAHELTHVVQQRGGVTSIQREVEDDESGAEGDSEDDIFALGDEAEADLDLTDVTSPDESLEIDPEDPFGAAGGSKKKKGKNTDKGKKKKTKADRSNVCPAGDCPQAKQKKMTNNDLAESAAVNKTQFITNLDVKIGAGEVNVTWSDGNKETWPCSANPRVTPKTTTEVVGLKGTKDHTNAKKDKKGNVDGMAWFTGFKSEGKRIGFHDSQPVGAGFESHGCVRVCCDKAEKINKYTSSGVTKITVVK